MATRRRGAKRAKPPVKKRSNSNINAAQQESREKQLDAAKTAKMPPTKKPIETGLPATKLEARTGTPMANSGRGVDQGSIAKRDGKTGNSSDDAFSAATGSAQQIAGLLSGIGQRHQQQAQVSRALADPKLYGTSVNNKDIQNRLIAQKNAADQARRAALSKTGDAVYMGTTDKAYATHDATGKAITVDPNVRRKLPGDGEFEGGQYRVPHTVPVDQIVTKDELMSWLADEKTFNQIRTAAKKAGIDVQSYDDVAKLWQSVVTQAAATYSTTGKKVTPWALLQLRGKTMVGGKPASKTTTSTTIDEMDPAQAKVMIKNSLQQALGRDPRQDEIDDFISKAQTIAQQNPQVTKTTTQFDFAGSPTDQTSVSRGGGDVVSAKAQLAAESAAESAPDYAQYQAAGVYAPWMFEALASPI